MQVNLQRSQNWIMFFHSSVDVSLASWAEHYKQSPSSKGGGALKSSPSLYFFPTQYYFSLEICLIIKVGHNFCFTWSLNNMKQIVFLRNISMALIWQC